MSHRIFVTSVRRRIRIGKIGVSKTGIRYVGTVIIAPRQAVVIGWSAKRADRVILRIARLRFVVCPEVTAATSEIGQDPGNPEPAFRTRRIIRRDTVGFGYTGRQMVIRYEVFYRRKLFKVVITPLLISVYYGKFVFFARFYAKRQYRFAVFRVRRIVYRLFFFMPEIFTYLQRYG